MSEDLAFSIEVEPSLSFQSQDLSTRSGAGGALGSDEARHALDRAAGLIKACADRISAAVSEIGDRARPEEIEASFGVKFSSEAGAILAKASTEANIQIKMKWKA